MELQSLKDVQHEIDAVIAVGMDVDLVAITPVRLGKLPEFILRRDPLSIAISLVVFLLYGSMVWGILPIKAGISFESHFFGAVTGTGLAILLRRYDPASGEKRYDWEDETKDIEDPVVEDPRRSVENARKQVERFFD